MRGRGRPLPRTERRCAQGSAGGRQPPPSPGYEGCSEPPNDPHPRRMRRRLRGPRTASSPQPLAPRGACAHLGLLRASLSIQRDVPAGMRAAASPRRVPAWVSASSRSLPASSPHPPPPRSLEQGTGQRHGPLGLGPAPPRFRKLMLCNKCPLLQIIKKGIGLVCLA